MNGYICTILLFNIIEVIAMFVFLDAYLERKPTKNKWAIVAGAFIATLAVLMVRQLLSYKIINGLLLTLIVLAIASAFFEGGLACKIPLAALFSMLSVAVQISVFHTMLTTYQVNIETVMASNYSVLSFVLAETMLLALCVGLRAYRKRQAFHLDKSYWFLFVLIFFSISFMISLLFRFVIVVNSISYNIASTIATFMLLVSALFALCLYEQQGVQAARMHEQEKSEQQLTYQLKYMHEVMAQQEALRSFKHDIKNQLIVLQSYIEEKGDEEEMGHIERLSQKLKEITAIINTGNPAIDALLSEKKDQAHRKGIAVDYHLQIAKNLPLAPDDVCIFLGNALDNAIEACEKIKEGDKQIKVTIVQQEQVIFFKITNTIAPDAAKSLASDKDNTLNHGYGLKNMAKALDKYGASPSIHFTDKTCELKCTLFTP